MGNSDKKNKFVSPGVESDSIESLSLKLLQVTDELKKANQELERKNRELEAAETLRKSILANISHDLRAPITAVRSAITLLSSDDLSSEVFNDTVSLIDRRVCNLESLIQDLYFLACVEDNLRPFEFEKVKLGPFLENYFFDATVDERYDNHDMQLDVPIDMECEVSIDIQKTIRVLDNLFTNAAKYSGSGTSITLKSFMDNDKAVIIVSDNGVGIPPESINHIFDTAYTVSKARTPGIEAGTGLGLSIVKAVIEKENGTVRCESEIKKGSSFIIELPICK